MEFPIEQKDPARIKKRLQYAMIEALFRQKLLTDAQRRGLHGMLQCGPAAFDGRTGGTRREAIDR